MRHTIRNIAGRNRTVLMLKIFIDETGRAADPNTPIVGVAGAAASAEVWDGIENDWSATLADFNVKRFHAVDLEHFAGEFKQWDEPKREAFLSRQMKIIKSAGLVVVGRAIYMRVWHALSNLQREYLIDPYFLCIQACWEVAAREALDANVKVSAFVEHQPEFSGRLAQFFFEYRRHINGPALIATPNEPVQLGDRFDGIYVADKDSHVAFQVADWIAYEMNLESKRQLEEQLAPTGGVQRSERWWMRQIRDGAVKGVVRAFGSKQMLLDQLPSTVGGARPV